MKNLGGTSNEVHGGQVDGALIQAGAVHGGIHLMNRSIGRGHWSPLGLLWRFVASLAGCAAVYGVTRGGTPLSGLAAACNGVAIPAGWTVPAANWVASHSEGVSFIALSMVTIGILSLPRPPTSGWDVGGSLEWRSPSTTVLAASVLAQCGWSWWTTIDIGLVGACGVWIAGRNPRRFPDRRGIVSAPTASLVLALVFAPVYVGLWLFARDEPRAT
ncbi:hypothetical protein [Kitasatospora sp. NPDC098663]|uniref:hypothetical protein n=1 Tax=Kitasatospora sp. NPDC098663 TaxID=3364096 RepID=UPI003812E1B3